MNVGFIGLGLMGRPMALHLAAAGHALQLWARRAASLEPFKDAGAHIHASAAEAAKQADVVFTMVADAADVEAVCLGADGIVADARALYDDELRARAASFERSLRDSADKSEAGIRLLMDRSY